ncbi:homocitrate synthase family protein [Methanothermobacter wolfeii]|uniref:Homocitrate synthase family protein n=1 Tax=Methanothermobacter wolfeii TaxID=145261 RepID=A0A9E7RV10_METWO|nr:MULTISPECIES: homocitrate synthase family protein [Methanothermobacter]MDI6701929.1 homocitrate synthase family protein [Methanothermobacter wolfeii]MDI6841374.1 homocitrate synthase family protein [Methanothermobacter wolfeii]NLM02715.1 2-isopropylmalate synthase [Methanothermobacter wolfeii]QHN05758.1 2-isopropylmalate synthase [Methanothermobacter sp. THM-1]UXH31902.1 homocitrate synthase family protein [Methanothermobacter wolfeii]
MKYFVSPFNKEAELKFPEKITIYDTTLRDGEQTPGVCLGTDEKLEIARKLDELGIHQIESGFPVVSKQEKISVKAIADEGLNAEILALCRTKKEDIDVAIDCGVDGVITFMATSDLHLKHKLRLTREEALNVCMNSIEYAKDHGLFLAFSAEDATRTDLEFLKQIYRKAEDYGADRVHIADTVGAISPQGMAYLVRELKKEINADIALHCHNDFGMALCNSIAGLVAGGSAVSTTVNGIGERAGNTSLEELIMTLLIIYGVDLGFNISVLYELSRLVEKHTLMKVPENKPIVGKNVFRHESGIHVDAVIEEPLTYEPFLPEMIGHHRRIVLGKHSGCRAVKAKLEEYGIDVTREELCRIVEEVKKNREKGKYINDELFAEIVRSVRGPVDF